METTILVLLHRGLLHRPQRLLLEVQLPCWER